MDVVMIIAAMFLLGGILTGSVWCWVIFGILAFFIFIGLMGN